MWKNQFENKHYMKKISNSPFLIYYIKIRNNMDLVKLTSILKLIMVKIISENR